MKLDADNESLRSATETEDQEVSNGSLSKRSIFFYFV